MVKANRYILPALVTCILLFTGAFKHQALTASRILYNDSTTVKETAPPVVAEPALASGAHVQRAQPERAPRPQPAPQPASIALSLEKSVEPPSLKGGPKNRGALHYNLNPYVLNVLNTYEIGSYPYLLNTDYANYNGVTEDISYQGQLLLKKHPSGNKASHCSGITFEVFFKAMQQRNREAGISISDFNGMTFEQIKDFMLTWYVANGSKAKSNIAVAVERYGLGKQIHRFEEAMPGDFVDLSRESLTGHTVVLINWVFRDGKIIGLTYWSSQGSTNGIDFNTEYFNVPDTNGIPYGNVMIDHVYIARVGPIVKYTR